MRYYIELSDRRNQYVLKYLQNLGCNALPFENEESDLQEQDIVVFSPAKKLDKSIVDLFNNNITVYGGNQSDEVVKLLSDKNVNYINFLNDEMFVVKNAQLTAEGVLSLLIKHTEKSIFQNNILIFGTGRVGRAIADLFLKLNLNFSLATSNKNKLAECSNYFRKVYLNDEYVQDLKNFDVIINTVPVKIFDDKNLGEIANAAVVMEVASFSFLNQELAGNLNINYLKAPALPQVFSAQSAGELMVDFILQKQIISK